jgi:hypothetical protein
MSEKPSTADPKVEANGTPAEKPTTAETPNEEDKKKDDEKKKDDKKEDKPAGGYDASKIPHSEPGYTIKITIHRAENIPVADLNSLSSDPYVLSEIKTSLVPRHKEDPVLQNRTFTIRKNLNPEWNAEWVVANIPANGCKIKCRVMDEDPGDHDDRLGDAHINIPRITEMWEGISEQPFKLKARTGSKRAYLTQALARAVCLRSRFRGFLFVSVKLLGKTESEHGGRAYTVGPMFWVKHYSPLLGRIVGQKTPDHSQAHSQTQEGESQASEKKKDEMYNFQANQMQLHGPVPAELYHRYVEFKPFVKGMFTNAGIRGFLLHKALTHQHNQVYRFDRKTDYGYLGLKPSHETTLKFLELVHFNEGGRIFTYILTLDSLFRFTETGKEFGIDMLSKHTMHSKVAIYIAFSGEFFVRQLKNKDEPPPEQGGDNETYPPKPQADGPPDNKPVRDPARYELVIDNDSGTYRPNADLLPKLKEFLEFSLPGLKIVTLDCNKDAELQQKLKKEQRETKKRDGDGLVYQQMSDDSSVSSSDISDLDDAVNAQNDEESEPGLGKIVKNTLSTGGKARKDHYKKVFKGHDKLEEADMAKGSKEVEQRKPDGMAGPSGSEEMLAEEGAVKNEEGAEKKHT